MGSYSPCVYGLYMANPSHNNLSSDTSHRSRELRSLFVHRDADVIEGCVRELKKAQFIVKSDFVLNPAQGADLLQAESYDVVVAEHPGSDEKGLRDLLLLQHALQETPLLLLTTATSSESIAQLNADGLAEYVAQEHLVQLPMAVRRALSDSKLRADLEDARKALSHSQSLYRALSDNPAYGIYRCDAQGVLLDVNQALITMLGYDSREELLAANRKLDVIPALPRNETRGVGPASRKSVDPIETEWKRKDGSILRARLSGRGVYDDNEKFAGHEIIAVDSTEQRTIEDQLRLQASTDSLTGLGNHRRLFEVLNAEIQRSGRSGREFSLLLLDLDGLKKINDQFGHPTGSRALCRLAQILTDCSRSIDTAARHGGDEFAIVLPETSKSAAVSVAQRICDVLQKETEEPALSVSVGLASYPTDADTIGALLYAADRALYEMKAKGLHTRQPASSALAYRLDQRPAYSEMANEANRKQEGESSNG
jgi:diguanylate cyclase (GGDEF)-like protein/PAS domain S-box-containing protein